MRIYRCFLGVLLAVFIVLGVILVVGYINEQGSSIEGTLIWKKGVSRDVSECYLC